MDSADSRTSIELIIDEGPLRGTVARIKVGHYLVGRHEECQIRYDDSTISQRHCLLWNDGKKIGVSDLHSTLGTFVNGEKLEPHVWKVMQDRDFLKVGELTMRVVVRNGSVVAHSNSEPSISATVQSIGGESSDAPRAIATEVDRTDQPDSGTRSTHMGSSATTLVAGSGGAGSGARRGSITRTSVPPSKTATSRKKPPRQKAAQPGRSFTAWANDHFKLIAVIVVAIGVFSLLGVQAHNMISGPRLEIREGLD